MGGSLTGDRAGDGGTLALVVRVARAPELRRVLVAYVGFSIAEHATWLAILLFALQRGGATEVALVAVVQLVPAMLLTPFAAYAGDRFRPDRALMVGYLVQAVAMAATASAMFADAHVLVYFAGAVAAAAVSFTRPVMGTLLPNVTHTPNDLIAANVVKGVIEQVGRFVGPLVAGLLLIMWSPASVFVAAACVTAGGAWAIVRTPAHVETLDAPPPMAGAVLSNAVAGFVMLARAPRARVLVGVLVIAGLINGVGDVVFVTFAAERLEAGGGATGALAAAYGLGGAIAAFAISRSLRTGATGSSFVTSALLVALAFVGLSVASAFVAALPLFAALGAGESLLLMVASVTVQRDAPTELLARLFGIVEGAQLGAMAVGSLLVTWLAARSTTGQAFVVLAVLVVILVLLATWRLRRHGDDVPVADAAIVGRLILDPVLESLPAPKVERLARGVERRTVPAGVDIVVEGDEGEEYFLIVDGICRVEIQGRPVGDLDAGRSFGELALLRDIPRSATVRSLTGVDLLVIGRDDFLEAVTGHPRSLAAADRVVQRYDF